MTKNQFKQFAGLRGCDCEYSGHTRTMYVYGKNTKNVIALCRDMVDFKLK